MIYQTLSVHGCPVTGTYNHETRKWFVWHQNPDCREPQSVGCRIDICWWNMVSNWLTSSFVIVWSKYRFWYPSIVLRPGVMWPVDCICLETHQHGHDYMVKARQICSAHFVWLGKFRTMNITWVTTRNQFYFLQFLIMQPNGHKASQTGGIISWTLDSVTGG